MEKGIIFVVSAPSGAGKTSLLKEVLPQLKGIGLCVSHTSRAPRKNERNGVDYHFVSADDFQQKIAEGDFVEWAEVFGNYYGTSRAEVEQVTQRGKHVILEIDWQGAAQMKTAFPDQVVTLAILPPSMEALSARLHKRGTDADDVIAYRMQQAKVEIENCQHHDFCLINDDFLEAADALLSMFKVRLYSHDNQRKLAILINELLMH